MCNIDRLHFAESGNQLLIGHGALRRQVGRERAFSLFDSVLDALVRVFALPPSSTSPSSSSSSPSSSHVEGVAGDEPAVPADRQVDGALACACLCPCPD